MSTRTVHDPFTGQDVQISNKLTDRLQGKYACGPVMPNGEPEFGWRQHEVPPIQIEAATRILALEAVLLRIAALDPEGIRADDLGQATRIARAALQ